MTQPEQPPADFGTQYAASETSQTAETLISRDDPLASRLTWLWVLWHRIRGHKVARHGWSIYHGNSREVWWCLSERPYFHADRTNTRHGWAPRWIEWRERG